MTARRTIAFARLASEAAGHADALMRRWLPDGRREGHEWVARNPTRADRREGSFKVNLKNGRWGDFSNGDGGGDLISLAAYLFSLKQSEAALKVAEMMGVDPFE